MMDATVIIGALITMILTVPTLLIGRFICGFAAGVFNICMAKIINESVPPSMSYIFEPMTNIAINFGGVISLLLGLTLPEKESDYV